MYELEMETNLKMNKKRRFNLQILVQVMNRNWSNIDRSITWLHYNRVRSESRTRLFTFLVICAEHSPFLTPPYLKRTRCLDNGKQFLLELFQKNKVSTVETTLNCLSFFCNSKNCSFNYSSFVNRDWRSSWNKEIIWNIFSTKLPVINRN